MITPSEIKERKGTPPLVMLTAYDHPTARILEEAGVDLILVGDSLGNVFQGKDSTREVTLDQIAYHTEAVRRGAPETLVVSDLPYQTYDTPQEGAASARRLADAGADAVKLEGHPPGVIAAIVQTGIPVMGHLGLLPQTARDFKVRGRSEEDAARLLETARAITREGVFSLVLECIPESLGTRVTEEIAVPTIGIGAGRGCSGQVLVINDLLGMSGGPLPRFVRPYAHWQEESRSAVSHFADDVRRGNYPGDKEVYQ